jgi:predicted SAM-dependent methyltransferase
VTKFELLRDEDRVREFLQGTLHNVIKVYRKLTARDQRYIRNYLATHPIAKLQIGAGHNLRAGWLNTNWYPNTNAAVLLDATNPFPLSDASFDYVHSEHVIEHLPEPGGANLIRETFRILKPGGKFRMATPDINFLFRLMKTDLGELEQRYIRWAGVPTHGSNGPTPLSVVNKFVREWGHLFIYDEPTLAASMRAAGFTDIKTFNILESDDPELEGLENAARMEDGFLQLETMTLEGTKPR